MFSGENNPLFGKFGKDHPGYGHEKTPEGRAAISAAHKGKKLTETQKKAISDARSAAIGVYDTDREQMYRRRCSGEPPKQIAEDFPITTKSVDRIINNWWRDHNLPKPKPLHELNPGWRKYKKPDEPNAYRGSNARASKFTDEERKNICQRRLEGQTYSIIGKSYGKGVSTIRNICQVWGPENGYPFLKINGEREQAFTKEQKAEMCKRRTNGETFEAIAKDYNATFQNVHGICSDWGPKNSFPFTKTRGGNSTE